MPPHLLVKAAFVRGELDEPEKRDFKSAVRTNFILRNVYKHLLGKRCYFNTVNADNQKEKDVLVGVIETVEAFRLTYAVTVKGLCSEIGEVSEDNLNSVLLGVSNELFSEGITWGRIIALFVFVGELTLTCLSRNAPNTFVDTMYDCFTRLVDEKLESWIEDHNGWEGITSLTLAVQEENASKTSSNGWAKSLLYSTVKVIGTMAKLANPSDIC